MADPDAHLWAGMLAHLRAQHPTICRQWFEELEPLGVAGGALQLRTPMVIHRDYLRRHCAQQFADAAQAVSGHLISVRFLGPEDAAESAPPEPRQRKGDAVVRDGRAAIARQDQAKADPQRPVGAAQPVNPQLIEPRIPPEPIAVVPQRRPNDGPGRFESLVINPDNGFENFVVGPGNRLAHAAALAVAANPGKSYNPFFVHGGVGLGKTHLLQAVCLKIAQADPSARMHYTSCEGFVTEFIESVQSGEMSQFRHRFRDVDVLVIDDIHFLAKRERTQEEFFHTFNTLYQAGKQIILSSDAAPEEIPDLEDRLVSRFKWGLVTKIDPPDFETRAAILQTKARMRQLNLPREVAEYLADRISSNIRELEGAIVKLQMQSIVEKREIDLDLARLSLGDQGRDQFTEPSIQVIIGAVTDFYRIRLADLQSKHRQRSITLPRQVCMYFARKMTRHSLEEIGGYFGGRDHTTVMHAIKIVESRRGEDGEFDGVMKTLEERIRSNGHRQG